MNRMLIAVICLLACGSPAQVVTSSARNTAEMKQGASAGDVRAQLALALAYEKGEGVPQNDELAVKWYRAAAEQGDATAQNSLGVMYRLGHGVERDYEQARQWYEKAASQKLAAALFNLGTLYYNGDGVAIDDARAYVYFVLAEETGSKEGATAVQRMRAELSPGKLEAARFFLAENLEAQPAEAARALQVYEELAQQGHRVAQIRVAKMYLDGRGAPKEAAQARGWCEAAAKERFSPGMVCLGYLYQSGALGDPAFTTAREWYEKAAKEGNPIAMYSLGVMYAKGTGVKQDNARAYLWYSAATRGGVALAQTAKDSLRPKLKPGQIASAEKQAARTLVFSLRFNGELGEFGRVLKFD